MSYKISQATYEDLKQIWLYTAENWSLEQADKYIHLIIDGIELLAENPAIGRDRRSLRMGYFGFNIESHVIFYKFPAENVEIIRILHQKIDLESNLLDR